MLNDGKGVNSVYNYLRSIPEQLDNVTASSNMSSSRWNSFVHEYERRGHSLIIAGYLLPRSF